MRHCDYYLVSQSLQVNVNGQITNRREFCVGERLKYICRIPSTEIHWRVPPYRNDTEVLVTSKERSVKVGDYVVHYLGPSLSTLDITVVEELNGASVSCVDARKHISVLNESVSTDSAIVIKVVGKVVVQ